MRRTDASVVTCADNLHPSASRPTWVGRLELLGRECLRVDLSTSNIDRNAVVIGLCRDITAKGK